MHVTDKLHKQMESRDKHARPRSLREGEHVWVRNYLGRQKWVPGSVVEILGPLHYKVRVDSGIWHRHIDQLSTRSAEGSTLPATEGRPGNFESVEEENYPPVMPKLTHAELGNLRGQNTSKEAAKVPQPITDHKPESDKVEVQSKTPEEKEDQHEPENHQTNLIFETTALSSSLNITGLFYT